MLNFLKNLAKKYNVEKEIDKKEKKQLLSTSLDKNIEYFKKSFDESADLTIRLIKVLNTNAAIITMEGMINKETFANSVLNPIVYAFSKENLSGQEKFDYIKNEIYFNHLVNVAKYGRSA